MKLGTRLFLRSLITNMNSEFKNFKCWMQYGGPKCKKNVLIPMVLTQTTVDSWYVYTNHVGYNDQSTK